MEANANGPLPGISDISPHFAPDDPLARFPRLLHPQRHPELPVGQLALRYLLEPRREKLLRALLGEEPVAVQSMFYFKPPGARGQALHQDNFYLRVKPGTCIGLWLALDDTDQENGALVIVPGTGQSGIFCPEKADPKVSFSGDRIVPPEGLAEVVVPMKAGDLFCFNGNLIHGSYPNTSRERFRRAFICHYVPRRSAELSAWFRPAYTFQGEELLLPAAVGGGPCGIVQEAEGVMLV
jgi:hypothetical protein